jgi:hypothetical protein
MYHGVPQGVASAGEAPKPDGPRNARQRHAQGKPKLLFGLEEAICLAPSVTAGATMPCVYCRPCGSCPNTDVPTQRGMMHCSGPLQGDARGRSGGCMSARRGPP